MNIKLASAKKKFDDWRNEHGPRGRLPCNLKQLAINLAREHELTMVAGHLGLKPFTLKKWLQLAKPKQNPPTEPFVALPEVRYSSSHTLLTVQITSKAGLQINLEQQPLPGVLSLLEALEQGGPI